MSIVYLNGRYLPLEEATISVMDRGFIFADGVYEVIPVFGRTILRLTEHLQRLDHSLRAIYMDNPLDAQQWRAVFDNLIQHHASRASQSLYVQVTRGVSERVHAIDASGQATIFAMCRPVVKDKVVTGIRAIVHEDIRWDYNYIKAIGLLPSVLLRHQAHLQGAQEAILAYNGMVSEGAASNVFLFKDGLIRTPKKSAKILAGVTRDLLLELLRDEGIAWEEGNISEGQLRTAEEIWLTSSTAEIVPVVQLDGIPVGSGRVGRMWKRVNSLYQQYKQRMVEGV